MGKRRNRNRVNATGRNNTSRFVRLDYRILNSNAYRSLTPNARALLVELGMLYNGENNGSLYLSVRDGAHRMGVADLTAASRAFDDLVAMGFIKLTQEAHFTVKAAETSRARCWSLTWAAGPGRKGPGCDFEKVEPAPGTKAHLRMERGLKTLKAYRKSRDQGRLPVLDSDTEVPLVSVVQAQAVSDFATVKSGNDRFPPKRCVPDFATHIATPWGVGTSGAPIGWWQADWAPLTALVTATALVAHFGRVETHLAA
ncbi:hypothetical protein GRI97_03160 [Altererythrobacter xixiisoli]|uniref:Uncharacterized protein n=1 Tax=Croceibacterium xixiisoli TaxID=1476466 RepID=A0A6I4TSU6_9SPHN|nr:hypothetical protein [Croceibacterium xixiisoli]MXO97987.1 hypothetical protein [Croceibacterium xixiisoli]